MRRRMLLGTGASLLALGACTRPDDAADDAPSADAARSSDAGGGGTPAPSVADPSPVVRGEQAPTIPWDELSLPLEMSIMITVDPGWTSAALQLDGLFLASRAEAQQRVFTAVHANGMIVWEAPRPLDCPHFALSRTLAGDPVAVLTDHGEDGAPTATGYHLATAERLWGPVPLPGELDGPGLVCTGDAGERVALFVADGTTVPRTDGERVLAEHLGRVLCVSGGELLLREADATEVWRAPLPGSAVGRESVRVFGRIGSEAPAFAAVGDDAGVGGILTLEDGEVLAADALAVEFDAMLETAVIAQGRTVRGLDPAGVELWRYRDPKAVELVSAGVRTAYLVRAATRELVVLDTGSGRAIIPYAVDLEAPLGTPETFSATGAAAVRAGERRILVTTEPDPGYGLRGEAGGDG